MMHGPINIRRPINVRRQYYEQDGVLEYTIESVTADNIKAVVMMNLRRVRLEDQLRIISRHLLLCAVMFMLINIFNPLHTKRRPL